MSFRLFREQFSDVVDQPKVKLGIGLFLGAVALASIPLAIYAGDHTKKDFCQSHNCTISSENKKGDALAVGFSAGVMLMGLALVSSLILLIIFCRVNSRTDSTDESAHDGYQTLRQ